MWEGLKPDSNKLDLTRREAPLFRNHAASLGSCRSRSDFRCLAKGGGTWGRPTFVFLAAAFQAALRDGAFLKTKLRVKVPAPSIAIGGGFVPQKTRDKDGHPLRLGTEFTILRTPRRVGHPAKSPPSRFLAVLGMTTSNLSTRGVRPQIRDITSLRPE
jgi:hypothetical protein